MAERILAWIEPLEKPTLPGKPDLPQRPGGGEVEPPIVLPPVPPGVDEPKPRPPGEGTPEHPITLPDKPSLPPGFVWPPFDPSDGIQGKALLLVVVPGATKKFRWVVIDVPQIPGLPPMPPIGKPEQPPLPSVPEREPKR